MTTSESKVHMITLGCARNRVDAEVMLASLLEKGWKISDSPENCEAVIVNTCGFIGAAKTESIDTILEMAKLKEDNSQMKLVVSGCLTQRYKGQLASGLPEVDLFIGTDEFVRLPELLDDGAPVAQNKVFAKRTNYLYDARLPKINTLAKKSAYVKVAEGCQHKCSFCIIPAIRGPLRSRPLEDVVLEVTRLAQQGVIEVNLIAQDLAAYGREQGHDNLLPLLKALVQVEGIQWIRMLYVYPENITDEFLDFFANEPKLVKYLDVPVQHGSDRILKLMDRELSSSEMRAVFKRLRERVPGIVLRTTVMVGFPGETEEDFVALRSFVEELRFDHLGCFSYSQEEGTRAARMPDQVEDKVKKQRHKLIMTVQRQISAEIQKTYQGKVIDVLVSGVSAESDFLFEGRHAGQAPEVDGLVYINDGLARPGEIQKVKISETLDYDLVGRALESKQRSSELSAHDLTV